MFGYLPIITRGIASVDALGPAIIDTRVHV